MEELCQMPVFPVDTREVRTFSKVSAVTGQRQIVNVVRATMLSGYDVFDVVRQLAVFL
jgi:hypothetical protein